MHNKLSWSIVLLNCLWKRIGFWGLFFVKEKDWYTVEERPSLKQIFEGDLDAISIYEKLSVANLGELIPFKTLLFFDEIQSCPQARTAVKFLVEDGKYDIITSGSLLGINYREVSSYPVGFEYQIEMHSLDFEEFLWANNIPPKVIDK